jgi:formylglycine-generating enzyme required for sulfatase activity
MGSEDFHPEERPVHRVGVHGFWIDEKPVTVAAVRAFVRETGHTTVAERPPDPAQYPDADPDLLVPGSLVFPKTAGPVALDDHRNWWEYVPGVSWRRPAGPGSTIRASGNIPSSTSRTRMPRRSRRGPARSSPRKRSGSSPRGGGGLEGAVFAWGDDDVPDGKSMANTWQGEFPWQNLKIDGFEGTSPVGRFPPNGYGPST